MSSKQDEQRLQQRKKCSKPEEHRGCCRGLAIIFSILTDCEQHHKPRIHRQVDDHREAVRKQRDMKSASKAQFDRTQDYMPIANDNRLNPELENRVISQEIGTETCNPHLEAIEVQANIGGWSIEPSEMEFHGKIGQGTTANIYRGTWRGLDVAIKWINPDYFQTNEWGETWFAQELDTLSKQRHPYVLRLICACLQPPQNAWLVTELLSGKTLTEWLYGHKARRKERSIPLPPLKERIEKGLEISQAMEYLHEQNPKVIHRDLKPSNILLDDFMHVRVADFGHARFLGDGEQALTGEMGTFVYMAPEVIRNEPYDEKCDVYSFGIVLNELITGEHPYSDSSFGPSQIAIEVAEGRLRPKLPEDDGHQFKELIDLVVRAWDEDASVRPPFAIVTSTLRKILENLS